MLLDQFSNSRRDKEEGKDSGQTGEGAGTSSFLIQGGKSSGRDRREKRREHAISVCEIDNANEDGHAWSFRGDAHARG